MNLEKMKAALASMDLMDAKEQEMYAEASELFSAIFNLGYAAGTAAKAEAKEGAQE
jgi:hypothetical protein